MYHDRAHWEQRLRFPRALGQDALKVMEAFCSESCGSLEFLVERIAVDGGDTYRWFADIHCDDESTSRASRGHESALDAVYAAIDDYFAWYDHSNPNRS